MTTPKNPTITWRGTAHYSKILGDPILNYAKDGKEWKMVLEITDKGTLVEAKKLGIDKKIKNKTDFLDGSPHISFTQRLNNRDGSENDPIDVVDAAGNPWDQSKLIGNGSKVDVRFVIVDYGKSMPKGVYIRGVRVLELVPFEGNDFAPLDEEDEFFKAAKAAEEQAEKDRELLAMSPRPDEDTSPPFDTTSEDDELDDDIPV